MSDLSKESIQPCIICGKVWQIKDVDKWVYHESRGVVCQHHHGVKEWYDDLIKKANEELIKLEEETKP